MYTEPTKLDMFYRFLREFVRTQTVNGSTGQPDYKANTECYGFSVKINGAVFKFNHNYRPIGKKSTKLFRYE